MSESFDKTKSGSILHSSYCGIAGKVQIGRKLSRDLEWLFIYRSSDDQPELQYYGDAYCIQRLVSRDVLTLPEPRKVKTGVALSGVLWTETALDDSEGYLNLEKRCLQQLHRGDVSVLSELRGDYVCALFDSAGVILARSLDANRNLYYRIDDGGHRIAWSTNYVELAHDSLSDIDTSQLAAFTWGADTMFYPGVERLERGEAIQVQMQPSGLSLTKYNLSSLASRTEEQVLPHSPKTYTQWAEKSRRALQDATLARASRFRKVGVLLSGGVDSAVVARCLRDSGVDTICYHVSSRNYHFADESQYAEAVARHLGLPLHKIDVSEYRTVGGEYLNRDRDFLVPHNHPHLAFWEAMVHNMAEDIEAVFSGHGGHLFDDSRPYSLWTAIRQSKPLALPKTLRNGISVIATRDASMLQSIATRNDTRSQAANGMLPSNSGSDIFSEHVRPSIASALDKAFDNISNELHMTSLDVNVFAPNGLIHLTPYTDHSVRRLLQHMPRAPIAYQGKVYQKPILNLAFVGLLPPGTIRRQGNPLISATTQSYCMNNVDTILSILHPTSQLVLLGIIDHERLLSVLSDRKALVENAPRIINACLVTLWLESLVRKHITK